jgi:hypothetical protein
MGFQLKGNKIMKTEAQQIIENFQELSEADKLYLYIEMWVDFKDAGITIEDDEDDDEMADAHMEIRGSAGESVAERVLLKDVGALAKKVEVGDFEDAMEYGEDSNTFLVSLEGDQDTLESIVKKLSHNRYQDTLIGTADEIEDHTAYEYEV